MNPELIELKGKNFDELSLHDIRTLHYFGNDLASYTEYMNHYLRGKKASYRYVILSMPLFCISKFGNSSQEQHVYVLVKYNAMTDVIENDVLSTTNRFEMQSALKAMVDMINTLDGNANLKREPVQVMQIVEEMNE